ncbi:MAG: hypothetical protein KCHDKBKB_02614 [Elusimicrobia bacterium]|nr:hypothetical protein [Elusimicrobiota bacterium]
MKKFILTLVSLGIFATNLIQAAEKPAAFSGADRFYGKITAIDHNQKNLTVHNTKQKMDARFEWSDQTAFISKKKPISVTELKVGQSLIVGYVTENNTHLAQRVTLREPFKKNQP